MAWAAWSSVMMKRMFGRAVRAGEFTAGGFAAGPPTAVPSTGAADAAQTAASDAAAMTIAETNCRTFMRWTSMGRSREVTVHGAGGDWSIFRPIGVFSFRRRRPKTWTCPLPSRPVNGYVERYVAGVHRSIPADGRIRQHAQPTGSVPRRDRNLTRQFPPPTPSGPLHHGQNSGRLTVSDSQSTSSRGEAPFGRPRPQDERISASGFAGLGREEAGRMVVWESKGMLVTERERLREELVALADRYGRGAVRCCRFCRRCSGGTSASPNTACRSSPTCWTSIRWRSTASSRSTASWTSSRRGSS